MPIGPWRQEPAARGRFPGLAAALALAAVLAVAPAQAVRVPPPVQAAPVPASPAAAAPAVQPPPADPAALAASVTAQIRTHVERWLEQNGIRPSADARLEVALLPGVMFPPRCQQPVVEAVAGRRLIGHAVYNVRCAPIPGSLSPAPTSTVTARAGIFQAVVVLPRGATGVVPLTNADVVLADADVTAAGGDVVTSVGEALGRVPSRSFAPGSILPKSVLRAPMAIRTGDPVRLEVVGNGFSVTSEATSLQNASTGDTIRIRNAEGQTLSGRLDSRGVVVIDIRRPE